MTKKSSDMVEEQTRLELKIKHICESGASSEEIGRAYDEFHEFLMKYGVRGKSPQEFIYKKKLSPIDSLFLNLIGSKRSVLEIGIGDGRFLLACKYRDNLVSGLDISKIAVCQATALFEENGIKSHIQVGDASKIEFASDSFDFVISKDLVEHLREADLSIHFGEVRRVLKSCGSYLLWTPSKLLGHTSLGTHLKEYSLLEITENLNDAGFDALIISLPLFVLTRSVKTISNKRLMSFIFSYEKVVAKIFTTLKVNIQHPIIYFIVPPICVSAVKRDQSVRA